MNTGLKTKCKGNEPAVCNHAILVLQCFDVCFSSMYLLSNWWYKNPSDVQNAKISKLRHWCDMVHRPWRRKKESPNTCGLRHSTSLHAMLVNTQVIQYSSYTTSKDTHERIYTKNNHQGTALLQSQSGKCEEDPSKSCNRWRNQHTPLLTRDLLQRYHAGGLLPSLATMKYCLKSGTKTFHPISILELM